MTVHADRPTEPSVAGATATGPAGPPSRRFSRPLPAVAVLVLLVVLAAVPLFLAPFETNTLSRILVFALFAVSLDLLVGITGLPSLGHAAYFGVGAYTAGLVSIHWTSAAPVPVLLAAAAGAVAAAATGWLAVRSGGVYFLMLTLAIGELVHQLAQSLSDVTGGSNGLYGIPSVRVAGEPLTLAGYVYWYILAVALLGFLGLWLVAHSPFGSVLRGIRDNEPRMRSLGYSPFGYKFAAFTIAGGFAGLAGGLLAGLVRIVNPSDAGFTTSALILLAVILGGAGTLWGPVLGAAVVVLVRDTFGPQLDGHGPLLLGVVFVVAVYVLPRGFAGIGGLVSRRQRFPGGPA
ncbi:branched-chain amino acid ABC transporter permease [Blastococcus saxobsidens]|uniref:Amino acid/amide ABC transporter membrane component, HAAT family n=1 Tax=Blastococcus saxobsidens (strain DD2) TaxID=1146883 RepID=H6RX31_BLASD|nr:branched-chain amino acid ABC transporter permease [Blastococcus saxobsidens]CCG03439.1 Amino acid/amide ABC transporter membrane component, HAAT family [Blastococcus saxobsidens DD2]